MRGIGESVVVASMRRQLRGLCMAWGHRAGRLQECPWFLAIRLSRPESWLARENDMYAPDELHILAGSAGLDDDEIATLWQQARKDALDELGSTSHPKYDHETNRRMMRLIEDAATEGIPSDLVPWVMFDIHVGALYVDARRGIKTAGHYIKEHLPGKHAR